MRSKNGMVLGQVFIFIIAAITFALIMIFGYQAISDFLQKGEQVEFVQFKTDLETSIKKIYTEYGSIRVKEFSLPAKYERICFVDLDKPSPDNCDFDFYACNVWQGAGSDYEGADQNVFLKPIAPIKIKTYRISINNDDKDYLCLDVRNGKFRLQLEGKGDKTQLSKP